MEAATAEAYAAAEAATLQAAAEHMQNLDPAALAASQQLEAITAALQQHANSSNMTAALEHLSNAKPEDLLAHLAVVSAVTGGAVEGVPAQHAEQHDVDGNQDGGAGGDRPLTSRYRGVCWNKKNRRWQAAINSSGKYIYLGSFLQEEEAARAFDRAAIRLRGNRAKLNYAISEYMDETGQLVEDARLQAHLANVLGKEGSKPSKGGASADGGEPQVPLLTGPTTQPNLYAQNFTQNVKAAMHILQQGKSPHYPYSGVRMLQYGVVETPEGATLTGHIPGDEEAFAVLYTGPQVRTGGLGAIVWDGSGAIDLGVFDTDNDARSAASTVLKLAMFYRHTLQSVSTSLADPTAAQQPISASLAQYGQLLTGVTAAAADQSAADQDAAAAMAAAAAAMAGSLPGLTQPDGSDQRTVLPGATDPTLQLITNLGMTSSLDAASQGQLQGPYKELFAWLANQSKKGTEGAADGAAGPSGAVGDATVAIQPTEADMAGAEAMTAMMMAVGGLKNLRDQGEGAEGAGEDGAAKRARTDDAISQVAKLSTFKLQDFMKSILDAQQPQPQQG